MDIEDGALEQSARWDQRYHLRVSIPPEHAQQSDSVVGAQGANLHLADGSTLIDMHGQYMCIGVGHGHPHIQKALHEAIATLGYVSELFHHEARGRASKLLLEDTMPGEDWAGRVRYVSTGSEAVEAALNIARLYKGRDLVVTTGATYHGWTRGAAEVTAMPLLRGDFVAANGSIYGAGTQLQPVGPSAISGEKLSDGTLRSISELEHMIRAIGVGRIAAVITELYAGAGGYLVPPDYASQLRSMTRRLGVLWIDDEVLCGAGRTGKWWAYQHYGVTPDILCTGKGITSSAVPGGACIVSNEIATFFDAGTWHTAASFSAHPLSLAGICATIEVIRDESVLQHVQAMGALVDSRLAGLEARHPSISGYDGLGLAWAINLVRDPTTGELWVQQDRWHDPVIDDEPDFKPVEWVASECRARGVLLFAFAPNTITLAPPLLIEQATLERGLDVIDEVLTLLDEKCRAD